MISYKHNLKPEQVELNQAANRLDAKERALQAQIERSALETPERDLRRALSRVAMLSGKLAEAKLLVEQAEARCRQKRNDIELKQAAGCTLTDGERAFMASVFADRKARGRRPSYRLKVS